MDKNIFAQFVDLNTSQIECSGLYMLMIYRGKKSVA